MKLLKNPITYIILIIILWTINFIMDILPRDAFSWMDPWQYFNFASSLITGTVNFNEFSLPSIFPLFITPFLSISHTIPSALFVNILFLSLLVISLFKLSKFLELSKLKYLLLLMLLSSPLLLGLSRSLYTEFSLSAVVALQYYLWLKSDGFKNKNYSRYFSLIFGFGIMFKMTYPLFFVFAFLVEVFYLFKQKELKRILRIVFPFLIPLLVVLFIEFTVFSKSSIYYISLGNTRIPIMRLIGPLGVLSFESIFYYFTQIFKTHIFLLTPLLYFGIKLRKNNKTENLLLSFILGPILVLIFQEVKEPRHIAPIILPTILIIGIAINRIKNIQFKRVIIISSTTLSILQYILITSSIITTPYYFNKPLNANKISQIMLNSEINNNLIQDPNSKNFNTLRWKYNQSIAISGFEANEALALLWFFQPAVTIDLDMLNNSVSKNNSALENFEDLFYITAFNSYNKRCSWNRYYNTIQLENIISSANYIFIKSKNKDHLKTKYPNHTVIDSLNNSDYSVYILKNTSTVKYSYRYLYGREYLKSGINLSKEDLAALYFDLSFNCVLRNDFETLKLILKEYPPHLTKNITKRNIYWSGNYQRLQSLMPQISRQRILNIKKGQF